MIGLWAGLALAGSRGLEVDTGLLPALDDVHEARRVALVVGVNDYADPVLGDLRYAEADAVAMGDALAAQGFDVHLMAGTLDREGFWGAFAAATGDLEPDDTFLLYYAGHGTQIDSPRGTRQLLLLSDGRLEGAAATGLGLPELNEALGQLASRQNVVILDACHSGQGRSALSAETQARMQQLRGPLPPPDPMALREAEVWLYAAGPNQPAREDEGLGHGVYTWFLLDALQGDGDLNGDGVIFVEELHERVMERTVRWTGGAQVPRIALDRVGPGSIAIAGDEERRREVEEALLLGFGELVPGTELWLDGQLRGPGAVPPGRHSAELRWQGQTIAARTLRLRAGETFRVHRIGLGRQAELRMLAHYALGADGGPGQDHYSGATLFFLPRDDSGGRPQLGLAGQKGLGPGWAAWAAELQVGWRWGGSDWGLAPMGGLGVRVRDNAWLGWEQALVPQLGLQAEASRGPLVLSMQPSLDLLVTGDGVAPAPGLRAGVGLRWP